jgi:hypothetical protein
MKKIFSILLVALIAALFVGCPAGTETNTNENTNANAEAPAKTVEAAVLETDDSFTAAAQKKDGKFFEANLVENFVGQSGQGPADKALIVKYIGEDPCESKPNPATDRKVVELADGIALMTGKSSGERSCGSDTKKVAEQYAVLWVKDGDAWKAAYYQGIELPVKEEAKADDAAKPAAEGEAKKEEAKPAAEGEAKKEEAPMKPNVPNDEAMAKTLLEIEKTLWAAWAKGDTKPFEDTLAANFMSLSADGVGDRAAEIKDIASGGCKISNWSIDDAKATKVNDNFYVMTYKGNQAGTCGEEALPKVTYTSTIFMKDGETWKPVFHANSPASKM